MVIPKSESLETEMPATEAPKRKGRKRVNLTSGKPGKGKKVKKEEPEEQQEVGIPVEENGELSLAWSKGLTQHPKTGNLSITQPVLLLLLYFDCVLDLQRF